MILTDGNDEKNHRGEATDEEGRHREWNRGHRMHLVHVFEIIRESDCRLYFVMEHMGGGSLKDYISEKFNQKSARSQNSNQSNKYVFDSSEISAILFQAFRGLCYVHSKGMVHRDIKPENILIKGGTVKLADFSLARPLSADRNCCPITGNIFFENEAECKCTDYVGTRWYRAPELLCQASTMTTAIDIFSMGLVGAELFRCHPLFRGSNEIEQLQLIENLLRFSESPYNQAISEQVIKERLEDAISTNDATALSFLYRVLHICPEQRPTAEKATRHKYFRRELSFIKRERYCNTRRVNNQQGNLTQNTLVRAEIAKKSPLHETPGSKIYHDSRGFQA